MKQDTRLAGYFEEIYEGLLHRGVPEDRLPTPWAILSHVLECVDYDALGEWIENYSALEALEAPDEATEDTESDSQDTETQGEAPTPRRRPPYLRALGAPTPETPPEPETHEVPEPESGS